MESVLIRAGCFVAIIFLGALLRRVGFFKESDFLILSRISLRITLPAAIVSSFAGKTIDPSLLTIVLFGLGMGVLCMIVGYLSNLGKEKSRQAFDVLNLTGCNVGALTIPFVQSVLGPGAVIVASLFDVGNAAIGLGTSYGIASAIQEGGRFSFKRLGKNLLSSVALITYIIMTALTLLGVSLPGFVLELAGVMGGANTFVAMLMIGVGFRLSLNRSMLGRLLKLVVLRYGIGAVLAVIFWNCLPFDRITRLTLVLLALSPIITAAPAYTGELKGDVGLSSAFNSLCIVLSILSYVVIVSAML